MIKYIVLLLSLSITAYCSVNVEEFSNEALSAHNLYRRIHGVQPLKLNPTLSKLALSRAQELASLGELNVKQNLFEGKNLGETVGSVGGFVDYNGVSATQLWYSVVSKFDEEGESSSEGASFTQIIWKSTRECGFGIAKGKDGKFYFVAEYFPSGNIRGQYENNVFQLTDELLGDSGSKQCMPSTVTEIWRSKLNNSRKEMTKSDEEELLNGDQTQMKKGGVQTKPILIDDLGSFDRQPNVLRFTTKASVLIDSSEIEQNPNIKLIEKTTDEDMEVMPKKTSTNFVEKESSVKLRPAVSNTKFSKKVNDEDRVVMTTPRPVKLVMKTTTEATVDEGELLGGLVTEQVMSTRPTPPKAKLMQETVKFQFSTPVSVEMVNGDLVEETTTVMPELLTTKASKFSTKTSKTTPASEDFEETTVENLVPHHTTEKVTEEPLDEPVPVTKIHKFETTTRRTTTTTTTTVETIEEEPKIEVTTVTTTIKPVSTKLKSKFKKLAPTEDLTDTSNNEFNDEKPVTFKKKKLVKKQQNFDE